MAYPKIKICGLTRAEDVAVAIEAGADYLGFIVEAKSSRRLSVVEAARLACPAKDIIPTVAVVVNPGDDLLTRITQHMRPDYIQLHGDETPERVADIRARFDVGLIKALPVSEPADLAVMKDYTVDIILLDAKPPKGAARGGHGVAFDWGMLKDADLPEVWALAGGITPENAHEAINAINPPLLDVSSGVETSKGVKDHEKVRVLISTLK